MSKMIALWSFVFAWVFASLASAQNGGGAVGGSQATCSSLQAFQYIGCYDLTGPDSANNIYNNYNLTIAPLDFNNPTQQVSYAYYPGWITSNSPTYQQYFDNSVTPYNCTVACRGHGFQYAALADNACMCGAYLPQVSAPLTSLNPNDGPTTNDCHNAAYTPGSTSGCPGDPTQQCGTNINFRTYGDVYVDPSFPDPSAYSPTVEAANYKYYGCFHKGQGVPDVNISPASFTVDPVGSTGSITFTSAAQCFAACASLGFPFADLGPENSYQDCQCSSEVQAGFQVADSLCNGHCDGSNTGCVSNIQGTAGGSGCCGQDTNDGYHAFYLNPDLVGCYLPSAPGMQSGSSFTPFVPQSGAGTIVVPQKVTARAIGAGPAVVSTNPPSAPTGNPTYENVGCYIGANSGGSTVVDYDFLYYDNFGMTQDKCWAYCTSKGSTYSSTIYKFPQFTCYCGNSLNSGYSQETMQSCHQLCPGNTPPGVYEYCGGNNALELLYEAPNAVTPVLIPVTNTWASDGCFSDNLGNSQIFVNAVYSVQNTVEDCQGWCQYLGYSYAGLKTLPSNTQFYGGTQCICGDSINFQNGFFGPATGQCTSVCPGNSAETCGGYSTQNGRGYVNIYQDTVTSTTLGTTTQTSTYSSSSSTGVSSTTSTSSSTAATTTTSSSSSSSLPVTTTTLSTATSTATTAAQSVNPNSVIFGLALNQQNNGRLAKRQSPTSNFVAPPGSPVGCNAATRFLLQNGLLSSGTDTTALMSTNPETAFQPLAASTTIGTIFTTFSLQDGELAWNNISFTNGQVYFCLTPGGVVEALFDGPTNTAYPFDCEPVSLVAIPAVYCIGNQIVFPTTTSSTPSLPIGTPFPLPPDIYNAPQPGLQCVYGEVLDFYVGETTFESMGTPLPVKKREQKNGVY